MTIGLHVQNDRTTQSRGSDHMESDTAAGGSATSAPSLIGPDGGGDKAEHSVPNGGAGLGPGECEVTDRNRLG